VLRARRRDVACRAGTRRQRRGGPQSLTDAVAEAHRLLALYELGISHRRGGYRDPESQAFIESWFSKLKQRCIWREEFETLDEARAAIGAYVDR
jgi:transposase InsO family protein